MLLLIGKNTSGSLWVAPAATSVPAVQQVYYSGRLKEFTHVCMKYVQEYS